MQKVYILLVVLLMAVSGWLGWKLKPAESSKQAAEAVVVETVVEKIVTIITNPDGTVVHEEKQVVKEKAASSPAVAPAAKKPSWAVSAYAIPRLKDISDPNWGFDVARRVSDTGLWVAAGFVPSSGAVSVGLRVEF